MNKTQLKRLSATVGAGSVLVMVALAVAVGVGAGSRGWSQRTPP
jgi:hypothetical protein